jgi:hypothetical protein
MLPAVKTNRNNLIISEFLTKVVLKMHISWNVLLCARASGSQHFKGLCCLIFNGKGPLPLADGNSLFICLNNSTNNTASHCRRHESSKSTVLNRIITPYYKTVYGRKTQSYLHSTMCNGEQFIEIYVIGILSGIIFFLCDPSRCVI